MADRDTVLQEITEAVKELEQFFNLKADEASTLLRDAQRTADDLVSDFQKEMLKREEELIKLRRENSSLKREVEEGKQMIKQVASLNEKIERMRLENEEALKERDKARDELNKIQELWKRFTSGE